MQHFFSFSPSALLGMANERAFLSAAGLSLFPLFPPVVGRKGIKKWKRKEENFLLRFAKRPLNKIPSSPASCNSLLALLASQAAATAAAAVVRLRGQQKVHNGRRRKRDVKSDDAATPFASSSSSLIPTSTHHHLALPPPSTLCTPEEGGGFFSWQVKKKPRRRPHAETDHPFFIFFRSFLFSFAPRDIPRTIKIMKGH